ncbi:unnamed protein product [Laminaria digitata]
MTPGFVRPHASSFTFCRRGFCACSHTTSKHGTDSSYPATPHHTTSFTRSHDRCGRTSKSDTKHREFDADRCGGGGCRCWRRARRAGDMSKEAIHREEEQHHQAGLYSLRRGRRGRCSAAVV